MYANEGFRAFYKELRVLSEILKTFGISFSVSTNQHVYEIVPVIYSHEWSISNWSVEINKDIDIGLLWSALVAVKAHGSDLCFINKDSFSKESFVRMKDNGESIIVAHESDELKYCYITLVFHPDGISISIKEER